AGKQRVHYIPEGGLRDTCVGPSPLKTALMLCGEAAVNKGSVTLVMASPLPSTEALALWPFRVKVTVPPAVESLLPDHDEGKSLDAIPDRRAYLTGEEKR